MSRDIGSFPPPPAGISKGKGVAPTPLVSVIIPLHQGAAHIGTTLDSLHRQTAKDFEVIIVDDGSTDEGPRLAGEHPTKPSVVSQPRRGVAAARNRGSLHARAPWLAYLDQDDLWHEQRLERMASVLSDVRDGFVLTSLRSFAVEEEREAIRRSGSSAYEMVDAWVPGGREVDTLCGAASPFALPVTRETKHHGLDDVLKGTLSTTTSFFVGSDHLRLIGGWSTHARSIDDWWLMANSAYLEPILAVEEPTHLYRIHAGATSRSTNFWYAYASSLAAARYGGNYLPLEQALVQRQSNRVAEHLYRSMIDARRSQSADAMRFTRAVASLLWPGRPVRRDVLRGMVRDRCRRLRSSVGRAHGTREELTPCNDEVAMRDHGASQDG